jgi:hypothetical protein
VVELEKSCSWALFESGDQSREFSVLGEEVLLDLKSFMKDGFGVLVRVLCPFV